MGLRTRHRGEHPRRLRAPAADQGGYAPAQAHPYREGRWVHDPVGGRRVKRISIGLRLTLWYLVIFALAQALFGVGMWYILRQNLRDIADRTLENTTEDVRRFLEARPGGESLPELQKAVADEYGSETGGDYLQITDSDGNWVYRAPARPAGRGRGCARTARKAPGPGRAPWQRTLPLAGREDRRRRTDLRRAGRHVHGRRSGNAAAVPRLPADVCALAAAAGRHGGLRAEPAGACAGGRFDSDGPHHHRRHPGPPPGALAYGRRTAETFRHAQRNAGAAGSRLRAGDPIHGRRVPRAAHSRLSDSHRSGAGAAPLPGRRGISRGPAAHPAGIGTNHSLN